MKKRKLDKKYNASNLFLQGCEYDEWQKKDEGKSKSHAEETFFERLKADDEDLSDMLKLESNEKVKLEPKQTIAERLKLERNNRKRIKNFNFEQIISWTSNIINTNIRQKRFA